MTIYHGTTKRAAQAIEKDGFHSRKGVNTATSDKSYAERAARLAAEEKGDDPVLVVFHPSAEKFFPAVNLGPEFGNRVSDLLESKVRNIHPKHISHIEPLSPAQHRQRVNAAKRPRTHSILGDHSK